MAAPRFEADDERAARGALRSLVRVPHVLPAQLIYDIVLVLYAPAHVQRIEDRHFFSKELFEVPFIPKEKSTFFPLFSTFLSLFHGVTRARATYSDLLIRDLATICMSLTSKCTSLSAIDGAAAETMDWSLPLARSMASMSVTTRRRLRSHDARCHRVEARDVLAAHAASAVWEAHDVVRRVVGSNAERGAQFGDRVSSDRPEVIQERRDGNQNVVEVRQLRRRGPYHRALVFVYTDEGASVTVSV